MTNEPITIRRATPQDAPAFARIMGDPEVLHNLMQLPYGAEGLWTQRLTDNVTNGRGAEVMLVAERGGRVQGSAGVHPVGQAVRRRHCAMLGISVAREAQGQGVGTALMQAICDYADQWAQILRLELTVYADNARAIRLYERFGFVHEGTHRGYALRAGRYVDAHCMARLHPQPPQIA